MQSDKFLFKKESLNEDQHAECIKQCTDVHDHMLGCCNVKFNENIQRGAVCPSRIHTSCAEISHTVAILLEAYYCEPCISGDDTGGLRGKMIKAKEVAESAVNLIIAEKSIETDASLAEALEELEQTTDILHMFNLAYQERDERIKQLEQENKSLKEITTQSEISDSQLATKVLGISWQPASESFVFKLNDDALLKKCNSDYIPCSQEVISQDLCRQRLKWKNDIPIELREKWQRWLSELKDGEELEIPRQCIADLATKWIDIDFSDPNQKWFNEPDFLYQPKELKPAQPNDLNSPGVDTNHVKVLRGDVEEHVMLAKPPGLINQWHVGILEGVSANTRANWLSFTRVVAIALRAFDRKLTKKSRRVNLEEQQRAEHYIIRQVQREVFEDEWEKLSKGKHIDATSVLFLLSPFFCVETKLIRARTRIPDKFPYDHRCPPIIPNLHEVTDTIIRYHHESHGHVGDNTIMDSTREHVWIISLRKAVERYRRRCQYCNEEKAKLKVPERIPLPERISLVRQEHDELSFFHSGVDLLGPIETYVGQSHHEKAVWIIIFTCLTSRSVYLEDLEDLTTESTMCAVQKLWARRGPIGHMYSDNGYYFQGFANLEEANDKLRKVFDIIRAPGVPDVLDETKKNRGSKRTV